jgi:hypothetical protein
MSWSCHQLRLHAQVVAALFWGEKVKKKVKNLDV